MKIQPVTCGNLVALPFNAAATRPEQHADCPTFGPGRDELWQQVLGMMQKQHQHWKEGANTDSFYHHFLQGRFALHQWPMEKITTDRDGFLSFETKHRIGCLDKKRFNNGFLIADVRNGELLGERRTGHMQQTLQITSGMDIIHPDKRGHGLSYAFFELGCLLARQLGYTAYEASVAPDNPASYKRLERMVKEGRAQKLRPDWCDEYRYRIPLQDFTARCD